MKHFFYLALLLVWTGCTGAQVGTTSGEPAGPAMDPMAGLVMPSDYAYPSDDTVRVVTWNVEHFVDGYDDPYIDNRSEDDPAGALARVPSFVAAIRALDADVVVLQEFESASYLQALAEAHFPEMGYRFFFGTESVDWYQNVVLMSRLPLGAAQSFAVATTPVEGETDDAGRPATQSLTNNRMWTVEVLARPGYTFSLTGLHLKAGRGARNEGWRRGQIRFLHARFARLLALDPDANLLIAGDLNMIPSEAEFGLLLDGGGATFIDPLAGQGALSHPAEAPERQLDHLLVNDHMYPELVPGSARVAMPLPQAVMAETSDHLPVMAVFLARER